MYYRTDDPTADAARYGRDHEEYLRKRPKCVRCKEHIAEEWFFNMGGDYVCRDCIDDYLFDNYRVRTSDYMEGER